MTTAPGRTVVPGFLGRAQVFRTAGREKRFCFRRREERRIKIKVCGIVHAWQR